MSSTLRTLRELPFTALVAQHPELRRLREQHSAAPPGERYAAAQAALVQGERRQIAAALAEDEPDVGEDELELWRPQLEALAIDPLHPRALLAVGNLELRLGRPDAGRALLQRLAGVPSQRPGWAEALDEGAGYLADHGGLVDALQLYELGLRRRPGATLLQCGRAACLLAAGQPEPAVEQARAAAKGAPDDPHVLDLLGEALLAAGHLQEAESVLERAVQCSGAHTREPALRLAALRAGRGTSAAVEDAPA